MTAPPSSTATRREIEEQQPLRASRVAPDRLRFRAGNRHLGDLRELAASLRHDGVLQPLLVHRQGSGYEVLDGNRRLAAALQAGLRSVPVVVVPTRSAGDALAIMVATALHKKDLEPGERAQVIAELTGRHGWTLEHLAARWGVSPATVSRWKTWAPGDPPPTAAPARGDQPGGYLPRRAPAAARPRRAPSTVAIRRVAEVADRWEPRVGATGLDVDEVTELLGELRTLTGGRR